MNKVIIATGGSGGHIFPALSLANTIKEKYPNCEIIFFGSSNHMEAQMIPEAGYRFVGSKMRGMNGNFVAKTKSALSLLRAQHHCKKLLLEEKPDICIGFGNYISVPLILAAKRLRIPTMIHEQNSFAGKANKMLGHYADAIVASYETSFDQFPKERTRLYGNPRATYAVKKEVDDTQLQEYGIDPSKPYVVSMMGSLGSSSVAKVLDEMCRYLEETYQVLLVVGKENDYKFHTQTSSNIHIVPFVDGITALKTCDLAILRAGATTLAEVTAIGVPCILIPSPFVPNNHQVYNAMELVKKDAAIMIEEKDLTAQNLAEQVNALMRDKARRDALSTNAKELGKENAANDMLTWIEDLIHG